MTRVTVAGATTLILFGYLTALFTLEPKVVVVEEIVTPAFVIPEYDEIQLSPEEHECLALNIYFESRGESLAGQAAVADVVMNRVEDSYYPNTICGVVQQAVMVKNWKGNTVPKKNMCQFSWFCDGLSDTPTDTRSWMMAYNLAEDILYRDAYRGITEGSTHYHATRVSPEWKNDRGMNYTGQIGQHDFYRWD